MSGTSSSISIRWEKISVLKPHKQVVQAKVNVLLIGETPVNNVWDVAWIRVGILFNVFAHRSPRLLVSRLTSWYTCMKRALCSWLEAEEMVWYFMLVPLLQAQVIGDQRLRPISLLPDAKELSLHCAAQSYGQGSVLRARGNSHIHFLTIPNWLRLQISFGSFLLSCGNISICKKSFCRSKLLPLLLDPHCSQRGAELIPARRPYWELKELWHGLIDLAGWKASGDAEQPSDPNISKQESGSALRSSSLRKVLNPENVLCSAFRACWLEDQLDTVMKNYVKCYVYSHSNIKLCIFMCVYIHKTTRLSGSSPCQWT